MTAYIVRRMLQMPVVILMVTFALFIIMHLLPGDPIYAMIGESEASLDPEVIAELRAELGLDDPVLVQYLDWASDLVRGDLGRSFRDRSVVTGAITDRMPVTLQLGLLSLMVAICVGVPAGTIAAVKRNSPVDAIVTLFAMFGVAVPNFWFSMMLIWVFVVELRWLPASGFVGVWSDPLEAARHMALPVTALGLTLSGSIMRYTRSSVLEVLNQDYVRTARAKGLSQRTVIIRHALRNSLLPVATIIGLQLGSLLAGSIIIESMFALPGIGRLAIQSINGRDYPMLQGVVLLFTVTVLLVNLVTDISYAILDPRIRYS
ncbi:MAG: ABC transporter permease [Dehalococcoidia bacterium]|nr:ABC transporter permease [Dehalococcoidia bacterium]